MTYDIKEQTKWLPNGISDKTMGHILWECISKCEHNLRTAWRLKACALVYVNSRAFAVHIWNKQPEEAEVKEQIVNLTKDSYFIAIFKLGL